MRKHVPSVLGVLAVTVMASATAIIPGCFTPPAVPSDVTIKHDDAITGHTEGIWHNDGTRGRLPANYHRTGTRTVPIKVGGHTYYITLCVAEDANNPNCVYVNTSCNNDDGWSQYCGEFLPKFHYPLPSDRGNIQISTGDELPVQVAVNATGAVDVRNPICFEHGNFNYNSSTGNSQVSIIGTCMLQSVPSQLVNCTISYNGFELDADDWGMLYGDIPVGAKISYFGDANTVAWNSARLGRSAFDSTVRDPITGDHQVHGEIVSFGQDLPLFSVLIVDGHVESLFGICTPN